MKVAVGSKCTEFIEEELQCGSSPSNSTLSFAMKESQMEDEVEEEPQPAPWREQTDEELEIQQGLRALAEEAPAAFAVGPGKILMRSSAHGSQRPSAFLTTRMKTLVMVWWSDLVQLVRFEGQLARCACGFMDGLMQEFIRT